MNAVTKRAAELGWKYYSPKKDRPYYRRWQLPAVAETIFRIGHKWEYLKGISIYKNNMPSLTAALNHAESRRKAKKGRTK